MHAYKTYHIGLDLKIRSVGPLGIYIYIHTYICVCIYIYIHTYMYTYLSLSLSLSLSLYIYVYIYIYVHIHIPPSFRICSRRSSDISRVCRSHGNCGAIAFRPHAGVCYCCLIIHMIVIGYYYYCCYVSYV